MKATGKQNGVTGTELAQLASSSQGAEFIEACRNGRADLVLAAIRRNPEVANRTEGVGVACENAQVDVVKILVNHNPDLCLLRDSRRRIPLHIAVEQGNEDLIILLLKACPESIEQVTSDNETSFHLAAKHCHVNAFLLMGETLKHNQDKILHMEDVEGNTVLHIAVKHKQIEVVKWLLQQDAKCGPLVPLNSKNKSGLTALDIIYQSAPSEIDWPIFNMLTTFGAKRGQSIDHSKWVQNSVIQINSQPAESGPKIGQSLDQSQPISDNTRVLMDESIWMSIAEHSPSFLIVTILGLVAGSTYTSALNLNVSTIGINQLILTGREIISHPLLLPNGFYSVACINAAFTTSMVGLVFCLWSLTKQWSACYRALPLICLALLLISYILAVEEKVPKFFVTFGSSSISSFALAWGFSMFVILITVLSLGLIVKLILSVNSTN